MLLTSAQVQVDDALARAPQEVCNGGRGLVGFRAGVPEGLEHVGAHEVLEGAERRQGVLDDRADAHRVDVEGAGAWLDRRVVAIREEGVVIEVVDVEPGQQLECATGLADAFVVLHMVEAVSAGSGIGGRAGSRERARRIDLQLV